LGMGATEVKREEKQKRRGTEKKPGTNGRPGKMVLRKGNTP